LDSTARALDLVVANREGDETGGRVIWTEPLRWVAAEDFEMPTQGAIPLVALPPLCPYRRMAIDALSATGNDSEVIYACTSLAGVEAALAAGAGVAILDQSALSRNPRLADIGRGLHGK
jgi:DNA-binding transcriptional LysR family regulator